MKYDFTTIMDRRGRDAIAVDMVGAPDGFGPGAPLPGFDPIPMWVADMNFPVVPTIVEAMIARAQHPAFGYFRPTAEYFDAIIRWQETRNGVLGGVVSALNTFCSRGDKVLVHSPTYIGFTHSLKNAGYEIIHSELAKDGDGLWRMDLADMEQKLIEHKIHAAILCSPHNPTGRVWEKWELEEAMELFRKYDVYVVSDEIWSDIILEGYQHTPTQSVSRDAAMRTIALYAPSKTFNLAGLVGSYHIIYNPRLKDRHDKESSLSHYNSMNVMSMHALLGAYRPEGYEWVDELRQVITGNINWAVEKIRTSFPGIEVTCPQGTYMLFLDCEGWCRAHGCDVGVLLRKGWDVGVCWQDGRPFHGQHHIRMNLALPLSRVQEAFDRLEKYVFVD